MNAPDRTIGPLLEALGSHAAESAWADFLEIYSETIFGVVRTFARDADQSSDCFLFVCERLAAKNYRRLRVFEPNGRAQFSTWMRAVVRNLCLDWHRSKYGRRGLFRSIASRSTIDQEIFTAAFHRGDRIDQICLDLSRKGYSLSYSEIESRVEQLRVSLSARQLWLVSASRVSIDTIEQGEKDSEIALLADAAPNPEMLAMLRETETIVRRGLAHLHMSDRILLRLRYVEGLPLLEVARLLGLKDAQTADRRIREAIERLRKHLPEGKLFAAGKPKSASV